MVESEFGKQVRSFVSCALALTPELVLTDEHGGTESSSGVRVRFNDKRKMSDREYSSLEDLLAKFGRIQGFLPSGTTLDDLKVTDSVPTVAFQANTQYQIVSVNAEQLEIAKDVARRARQIRDRNASGDHAAAKSAFDDLQTMLKIKRKEFIGGFETVRDLDDAVGMHGVGGNGVPRISAGGPLIFVLIEIWVS